MRKLLQVNKTSENKECTQPLIQATTSNKKLLFKAIDDLEDGGMASYSNALTFAYEAFNHVSQWSSLFAFLEISSAILFIILLPLSYLILNTNE